MKLVGATPGFIRRPFVRYNVVSGIFASIFAILMLTGALYYLQNELSGFVQLLDIKVLIIVYAGVLIMGDPAFGYGYCLCGEQVFTNGC